MKKLFALMVVPALVAGTVFALPEGLKFTGSLDYTLPGLLNHTGLDKGVSTLTTEDYAKVDRAPDLGSDNYIRFELNKDVYGARLQFEFDDFAYLSDKSSVNDVLSNFLHGGDKYAWAKIGDHFKVQVGQWSSRGADRFNGSVFALGPDDITSGDYGIYRIDSDGKASQNPSGSNNLFRPDRFVQEGPVQVVADFIFAPLTVTVGFPGNNPDASSPDYASGRYNFRVNYKLDGVGSFNLAWKAQFVDETEPDTGDGVYKSNTQVLGLQGTITAIDSLKLGIGYSLALAGETAYGNADAYNQTYHGIDLRAQFKTDALVLTTSNNLSLHTEANDTGYDKAPADFVLYDEVAATIALADDLHLRASFINTLATTTSTPENGVETIKSRDDLWVRAICYYNVTPKVRLNGGFALNSTTTYTSVDGTKADGDPLQVWNWAIPVGFRAVF